MTDLISRADAIAYIDRVIKSGLGRYKSLDYIRKYISALPSADDADGEDLIIKGAKGIQDGLYNIKDGKLFKYKANGGTVRTYPIVPSADAVQGWIPLNKQKSFLMMPDELVAVNVTWVNHIAPPYYKHIEDVPFVDTAVYYRGKWYWWDATVIDVLAEYGENCNAEQIDKDIEILAWMPLPTPYKGGDDE